MATRNRNNARNRTREATPPALIAFHVAERNGKAYWTRIGAAWDHEDAKGLTLDLELMPVGNRRIVLREQAAGEEDGQGA
jgi:hypothetical protein